MYLLSVLAVKVSIGHAQSISARHWLVMNHVTWDGRPAES